MLQSCYRCSKTLADARFTEFLALRKDHSFFECCQTPSLASALTLQPIDRYPNLDASIIFCDILVVPQAMGLVVTMEPLRGPVLPDPLVTPKDLERLKEEVDVEKELGYLFEAIKMTRKGLDGRVPLIGFCGAPWTLMAYMCEGGGSKTFEKCKGWLYRYPEESKGLLMRIAEVCADLLIGQVLAGAQVSGRASLYPIPNKRLQFSMTRHTSLFRANAPAVDAPSIRFLGRRTHTIPIPNLRPPSSPAHLLKSHQRPFPTRSPKRPHNPLPKRCTCSIIPPATIRSNNYRLHHTRFRLGTRSSRSSQYCREPRQSTG